jgi:O-antigen/teichoic acid export membrane protein
MLSASLQQPSKRRSRFLGSVLWSWLGVVVSVFAGILLSPITIRKLGAEGYGVWIIVITLADYLGLMDLGFRSATIKYTAHYRAMGEPGKVNEAINTAALYSSGVTAFTIVGTLLLFRFAARFENISPAYHRRFEILLIAVGIASGAGAVFYIFESSIGAFQRFDITSRISILSTAVRSFGMAAALLAGYGLLGMGAVLMASLALTYSLDYIAIRRVFPEFRLAPSLATFAMFRQMLAYGVHTFLAAISQLLLNQSAPVLIAHFLPTTAYAGYYGMAYRVPCYSVDLVSRVGYITSSHSAELAARNDLGAIAAMGIYINRYCFAMFAPMAMAMIVYGKELFRAWLTPEMATMSAPLLPVLATGITLGIAAQFNSGSILYGLGKHKGYAMAVAVEAALCVAGLYLAIPRYGIMGAAWVVSALLVLNRGLVASWLLSRAVHVGMAAYLRGIYVSPFLVAIPTMSMSLWVKRRWLPGSNLREVLAGGALLAIVYYAAAFFFCLESGHRKALVNWLRGRLHSAGA